MIVSYHLSLLLRLHFYLVLLLQLDLGLELNLKPNLLIKELLEALEGLDPSTNLQAVGIQWPSHLSQG